MLFDPSKEPALSDCRPWNQEEATNQVDDPDIEYKCYKPQISSLLGFNGNTPKTGPTACHSSTSGYLDDGGCYSSFQATGDYSFVNLFTKFTGTNSSEECQDYCVEGKYSFNGLKTPTSSCLDCNSGNFSSLKGQSECSICAAGSFSLTFGAQDACTSCEKGTKGPTPGATTCYPCEAGTFAPFEGLSLCYMCTPGTYSNVTRYPDTCIECPGSYYSNSSGAISCKACADGTYTSGFGASTCSRCDPGTYLVHSDLENGLTSTDQSTSGRATKCETCAAGTFSELPSTSLRCLTCAAGSFSLSKQSSCTLCPAGTFSSEGSSRCQDCLPGTFSRVGMSYCIECSPGSFTSERRQAECTLCAAGRYQDAYNQTSCLSCGIGTYNGKVGGISCFLCDFGTYSTSIEATACSTCDAQQNTTGPGKMTKEACFAYCLEGESGYNGVEPCSACSPGKVSAEPGTPCVQFDTVTAKWESSGINATYIVSGTCVPHACPLCAAGTFASNWSSTECSQCPLSTFSGKGQQYCTPCDFGLVTLQPGRTDVAYCIAFCSAGTASNTAMAPCYACHPGKYQSQKAQTSCIDCPLGSYMPRFNAPSCKLCREGSGTVKTGSIHESECIGWATKYLNPSYCGQSNISAANTFVPSAVSKYVNDEGILRQQDLEIVDGGFNYVDGVLVFESEGAPGAGSVASFSVSKPSGTVAQVNIIEGGHAYSSTGHETAYYSSLSDPFQPARGQDGTVSFVQRLPYVSLHETPDSFMSGCTSGVITVPHVEGSPSHGFKAYYNGDTFGSISSMCFGQPSGTTLNPQCYRDLGTHGVNYPQNPTLMVQERSIKSIHVREGSITKGCKRNGTLLAAVDGVISPWFQGSYIGDKKGAMVSGEVQVLDAMFAIIDVHAEEQPRLSVFPEDSGCRCGTGINNIMLTQGSPEGAGWGFVPQGRGNVYLVGGHWALLELVVANKENVSAKLIEAKALAKDASLALGLKWRMIGDTMPETGRELTNSELATQLKSSYEGKIDSSEDLEFTTTEWVAFGIQDLQPQDFILSNGLYFEPAPDDDVNHWSMSATALVENLEHEFSRLNSSFYNLSETDCWHFGCSFGEIGQNFSATFKSDELGQVSSVSVLSAGVNYFENASVVMCPEGTTWADKLRCCYWKGASIFSNQEMKYVMEPIPSELQPISTRYDPPTGCFELQQPVLQLQIGKAGGMSGSFEECLELVFENECRCGSGLEDLSVLSEGEGYVNGSVMVRRFIVTNMIVPYSS
jgi:hypothetical protein